MRHSLLRCILSCCGTPLSTDTDMYRVHKTLISTSAPGAEDVLLLPEVLIRSPGGRNGLIGLPPSGNNSL